MKFCPKVTFHAVHMKSARHRSSTPSDDTPASFRIWIQAMVGKTKDDPLAVVGAFEEILERLRLIGCDDRSRITPHDQLLLLEHTAERAFAFVEAESYVPAAIDALDSSFVSVHHAICSRLGWEPVRLAEYLHRFALADSGYFISRTTHIYADTLGDEGLRAYRMLLAQAVRAIPLRKPGEIFSLSPGEQRLLRRISDLENDPATLDYYLEGRTKDRSTPTAYGAAIDLYARYRRMEMVVELIQESIDWFGDELPLSTMERFRALLVHAGRRNDAADIAWKMFTNRNPLYGFRTLRETIGPEWRDSVWRDKALDYVRSHTGTIATIRSGTISRSDFIRLLIDEGELEEAWQEALDHDCSKRDWLLLADALSPSRPDDAVAIYQAHIESLEPRTSTSAYEELISILKLMREVLASQGRENEFAIYVSELKDHLARRRKLINMIDEQLSVTAHTSSASPHSRGAR